MNEESITEILILVFLLSFLYPFYTNAHPAWGIVVDNDKNIYFPDIVHRGGSIWKLDYKGQLHNLAEQIHAHNVNIDRAGNIITAHGEDLHLLIRINADGALDTLIKEENNLDFFGGNCAWSPSGEVIFGARANKKLGARDLNGHIREVSDFEFSWNQSIFIDVEGNIYAPDIGIDNGIVVKITPDGKAEIIARDLISKLDRPKDKHNDVLLGITKDPEGYIYISEIAGQRIIKILEDGQTKTFYTSENEWFPCGIDFKDGVAYILESRHSSSGLAGPRITKFDPDHRQEVIFEYEKYMQNQPLLIPKSPENGSDYYRYLPLFIIFDIALILTIVYWRRKQWNISH